MFRFLVRLFAVVGLLVVLLAVGAGIAAYRVLTADGPVPERIVLELDLDRGLVENVPDDPLAEVLFGRETTMRDLVDTIDRARRDPRVRGLVARLGGDRFSLAQAQELRAAIGRFRDNGRFALAFADTFGEFGPGNVSYYLASGFDDVWLQPVGTVGLTGLSAEVPFLRETLDMVGLTPALEHREEYKSFSNTFTEQDFTPAHREMMESMVEELTSQLVAGIAEGRSLPGEAVAALIDRAPLLDREAVEAGLIDRLGYLDGIRDHALTRAGAGAGMLSAADYLDAAGRPHEDEDGAGIALIHGVGTIERGESGVDPLFGGPSMGADTVVSAFEDAIDDPGVRAIVFRIDSGGGSAVGSESIRRAVRRARDAGKPVVVSMGAVAASGGYWIAMSADRIIAHPATLTGSIGVVAGKFVTDGLWDELGVNWGTVARGRNATMWSPLTGYDASERARLDALLDDIYAAFVGNVAEARNLPEAAAQDVAKGRVWTGSQASALGLVDELGGIGETLAAVREITGLPPDAPLRLEPFPKPADPYARLLTLAGIGARTGETAGLLAGLRDVLAPLEPLVRATSVHVLRAPETGLEKPR